MECMDECNFYSVGMGWGLGKGGREEACSLETRRNCWREALSTTESKGQEIKTKDPQQVPATAASWWLQGLSVLQLWPTNPGSLEKGLRSSLWLHRSGLSPHWPPFPIAALILRGYDSQAPIEDPGNLSGRVARARSKCLGINLQPVRKSELLYRSYLCPRPFPSLYPQ